MIRFLTLRIPFLAGCASSPSKVTEVRPFVPATATKPRSELFRAETQRAQLDPDLVILAELRAAEAVRVRSLLSLPAGTEISTPRLPPVPGIKVGWEELLARMTRRNQKVIEAGLTVEAAALRAERSEIAVRLVETMTLSLLDLGSSRFDRGMTGETGVDRGPVFSDPGKMTPPRADFEPEAGGIR